MGELLGTIVTERLTLVTVTLPERSNFRVEMFRTVADQTVLPKAHVVEFDDGSGFVATINRAVSKVDTEFFVLVDDDDLLLPNHVGTLAGNLVADVVWTWCAVEGRDWNPNSGYSPGRLQSVNYIPSNFACKTSLFRELGGYGETPNPPDWDWLRRAETWGASFHNVPEVTWVYRFHGENMTVED